MSDAVVTGVASVPLARVHADLDGLREVPLDLVTDDEVLELWRGLEVLRRRLDSIEHGVIAQATARRLGDNTGARGMPAFVRSLLGIDIGDARSRVAAAEACGPRQTLSGQPLPPICPAVAAAQATGRISNRHATVIIDLIDALPDVVQVEQGTDIETFFVDQAQVFDPVTLQKLAKHELESHGVDGPEPDYRERRRHFGMHVRPDGSCSFSGEGTAEFAEYLRVGFDAYAKPCTTTPATTPDTDTDSAGDVDPTTDATTTGATTTGAAATATATATDDPRTPGQRRHDAIIDMIKAAMRAGQIPPAGGLTATVVLTVDADDWATDHGSATTGHGVRVPTTQAKTWVDGDTRVITVALDRLRAVTAYSDSHRIYTENQRLAMNARDGGCAFPGCDIGIHRCEAHHMSEWNLTGRTTVAEGALLCAYHHRMFAHYGWDATMINGIPHFIPPAWTDPERKPLRNWMHHPHLGSAPPG